MYDITCLISQTQFVQLLEILPEPLQRTHGRKTVL